MTMNADDRGQTIVAWLKRIEESPLSVVDFFEKTPSIPFSRAQYYRYRRKVDDSGEQALFERRHTGGNRKLSEVAEAFIAGCVESDPNVSPHWLREMLAEKYECNLSPSGVTRALSRLHPELEKRGRGRPRIDKKDQEDNACGGFELIVALAYHLGWPQMTAAAIAEEVRRLKRRKAFRGSERFVDKSGRDENGRFTGEYSRRADIRESRFDSISTKRLTKNWKSMNIIRDTSKTIERKTMGVLSLPVVTMNGSMRSVDTALGQSLAHLAGYDYKQNTLKKYLNELKYLGVSTCLLKNMVGFWQRCWAAEKSEIRNCTMLCYYIDGNTKAVWSSKRVKKNKVTMLGRVMGCLEQVFIHDCFGRPVYFETYSGHAPCGEYALELLEKVEKAIEEVPGSRTSVRRVLVMDGASNSVKTLRAFASQDKYHYITALDDNQWHERKVVRIGRPSRYAYGEATLREAVIELEDSQQIGYLIRTRAVKIEWDNGKITVLLSSIPANAVGASEVVRSYFVRWPAEELQFKSMKSVISLHRVAGYGTQEIEDEQVAEKRHHAVKRIEALERDLEQQLEEISTHERAVAKLLPKIRRLKAQSEIENGKRKMTPDLMKKLETYSKSLMAHEREIKQIEKGRLREFRLLKKHQREWLRLQGKEKVWKVDVELDQILTYHRVGLAHLYAYFLKYFLGGVPTSMLTLLHKIIHLHAKVEQTKEVRKIIIDYNKKDRATMDVLGKAIEKMNELKVTGPHGQRMVFALGQG
jgi:transposase|tara:strand:- start:89 stop:2353 length:2265 start_codon:yes stop_codon:yes gene_type:complete